MRRTDPTRKAYLPKIPVVSEEDRVPEGNRPCQSVVTSHVYVPGYH